MLYSLQKDYIQNHTGMIQLRVFAS